MNKNWYIIYTKAGFEKKVAANCTKLKLENFAPLLVSKDSAKKAYAGFFEKMVFVNCLEAELTQCKKMEGVISILHWKDKPAVVESTEMDAIKEFLELYSDIRMEPIGVHDGQHSTEVQKNVQELSGKIYAVSVSEIKLLLPSLGVALIAANKMSSNSLVVKKAAQPKPQNLIIQYLSAFF